MGKPNKKVAVALSGGVDSAIAAYILKGQGYDVIGLTMRISDSFDHSDALNTAKLLGIDIEIVDLSRRFEDEIIPYFADEYLNGRTPNPCVVCNKLFKFGYLMEHALKTGAGHFATGHYAIAKRGKTGFRLLKGLDQKKDQSYFLFKLGQEELSKVIFPLGSLTKSEVRKIAGRAGIRHSQKKESQEICFIDGDYASFLDSYDPSIIPPEGDFVDSKGNVLGRHNGIYRYTVGQRRGLGISNRSPLYVLKIDALKNRVILGESSELYTKELFVSGLNWIKGEPAGTIGSVNTKIRYKTPEALSKIEFLGQDRAKVTFRKPQRGVTPGQAAVFYKGDEVLGGGWISS